MSKTNYTMPDMVTLRFVGIPNVKQYYRGDNYVVCDTEKPDTCIVDFDLETAASQLHDHAPEWEMVGKDRDFKSWVRDQLLAQFYGNTQGSAAKSQVLKGGAKITYQDGTEIHLPAGSKVLIEMPGGNNAKASQPRTNAAQVKQPKPEIEVPAETVDAGETAQEY